MWPREKGAKIHMVVYHGPACVCVCCSANTQQGAPIPLCHSFIIQAASKGLPHEERLGWDVMGWEGGRKCATTDNTRKSFLWSSLNLVES